MELVTLLPDKKAILIPLDEVPAHFDLIAIAFELDKERSLYRESVAAFLRKLAALISAEG
jgi:hypothetical protein